MKITNIIEKDPILGHFHANLSGVSRFCKLKKQTKKHIITVKRKLRYYAWRKMRIFLFGMAQVGQFSITKTKAQLDIIY